MESTSLTPSAPFGGFFHKIRTILEMIKFEHTIFALPFAYMGMFLAARQQGQYLPTVAQFLWVTVAMVGARSFAMSLNRLIDRKIDARNPRTSGRALPAGLLTPDSVMVFAVVSAAVFFLAAWMLEPLALYVWPLIIGPFVVYSYTKRFTWLNHVVLGICLGLAPIGAWIGLTNGVSPPILLVGLGVVLWTAGFDIIYACQDVDVDRRDGLFSIPARFGVAQALTITRLMHLAAVGLFAAAGLILGMGAVYYAGVGAVAALLAYENLIVSANDMSRLNAAFFTMNGVISLVIFLFTGADLLTRVAGRGV